MVFESSKDDFDALSEFYSKCHKDFFADERYTQLNAKSLSRFGSSASTAIEPNRVLSLEFNNRANYLAYSREDGTLNVFRLKSDRSQVYSVIKGAQCSDVKIRSISWHPVTNFIMATVDRTSRISIWDASTGALIKSFETGLSSGNYKCYYSPNGKWFGALVENGEFCLFDVDKNYELCSVSQLCAGENLASLNKVTALQWSHDGKWLYAGFESGEIVLFEVEMAAVKLKVRACGHTGAITCMKLDPDNRFLVAGSLDTICSFWDLSSMCCERVINGFDTSILDLDLSRDGVAVGLCSDNQTRIYLIESGACLYEFESKNKIEKQKFRFYPGKMSFLAVSDNDGVVKHTPHAPAEAQLKEDTADTDGRKGSARNNGNSHSRRDEELPRRGRYSKKPPRR